MDSGEATRGDYWNSFYRAKAASFAAPSQFALFVLGETTSRGPMIDLGCGTGRDAIYFSSQGRAVVGVDASEAAVEHCRQVAANNNLSARFLASRIDAPDLATRIHAELKGAPQGPVTVYARFFIHAINDEEEAAFLALASDVCGPGGLLAAEFRTIRDAQQAKVTAEHYRRFVDPLCFMANANNAGFTPEYFVEGFGYAKYKDDDAHVARCLMRRR